MGNKPFRYLLGEKESAEESLGDFAALPAECLYEILAYMDAKAMANLSAVNHLFAEVTSDNVPQPALL